eukprot:CAMPEP_0175249960 /NCGR_PEP_ID=MMETSP0093-20121207/34909_1 /TAXON_ID=311494 /ORGANISM="Alexandrium monilatum, Strain CCMP3105" /LENGTH=91 /DNA_ID=CAMNT_0016544195 /DNA_START=29 /DNA_END=304 /DNA_ORIENTATION=-
MAITAPLRFGAACWEALARLLPSWAACPRVVLWPARKWLSTPQVGRALLPGQRVEWVASRRSRCDRGDGRGRRHVTAEGDALSAWTVACQV